MRLLGSTWIVAGIFLLQAGVVSAQSTLDALQQELDEAKQQHQDVAAQALSNFFSQLDPAMASPDAAIALYQQAGGSLPDPSPVVKANEDETETEKEARLAFDQANVTRLGTVLQLQCGLMHYGALFVVKPDQAGLQADWVTWLKTAAQIYPKLNVPGSDSNPPPESRKKHKTDDGTPVAQVRPPPFNPVNEEYKAVKDTAITKFLAFKAWGDKEQGAWSVRALPRLYRSDVLEPLRTSPTEATLAAWDTYIAMANADESDNDRWNQEVFPPLQFDRACDDYRVTPNTEKLEVLVNLIKANPTNPHADDWIARVGTLMADYRASHGGAPATAQTPAAATNAAPANPNVTVTTIQQGDMTIVTTHTNGAPVAPAPPGQ